MKRLIKLGPTAAIPALLATSANAAGTLGSSAAFDAVLCLGQTSAVNFDNPNAGGYTYANPIGGFIYNV